MISKTLKKKSIVKFRSRSLKTTTFSCRQSKRPKTLRSSQSIPRVSPLIQLRIYKSIMVWLRTPKRSRPTFSCKKKRKLCPCQWESADKQSKSTRSLKLKHSGANSTESTGFVFSWSAGTSWQYLFTMWFVRHSDSRWPHRIRTIRLKTTRWTSSVSTRYSSWDTQRTRSHGTSSLKRPNLRSTLVRQHWPSTRCITSLTSRLLASRYTKYRLKSVLCISTKFSVSASKINFYTQMSR